MSAEKKTYTVIAPDVRNFWTDLEAYGPIAAAQVYATELGLEEGTVIEVQAPHATRRRYRVGKTPRSVRPRGMVR